MDGACLKNQSMKHIVWGGTASEVKRKTKRVMWQNEWEKELNEGERPRERERECEKKCREKKEERPEISGAFYEHARTVGCDCLGLSLPFFSLAIGVSLGHPRSRRLSMSLLNGSSCERSFYTHKHAHALCLYLRYVPGIKPRNAFASHMSMCTRKIFSQNIRLWGNEDLGDWF